MEPTHGRRRESASPTNLASAELPAICHASSVSDKGRHDCGAAAATVSQRRPRCRRRLRAPSGSGQHYVREERVQAGVRCAERRLTLTTASACRVYPGEVARPGAGHRRRCAAPTMARRPERWSSDGSPRRGVLQLHVRRIRGRPRGAGALQESAPGPASAHRLATTRAQWRAASCSREVGATAASSAPLTTNARSACGTRPAATPTRGTARPRPLPPRRNRPVPTRRALLGSMATSRKPVARGRPSAERARCPRTAPPPDRPLTGWPAAPCFPIGGTAG